MLVVGSLLLLTSCASGGNSSLLLPASTEGPTAVPAANVCQPTPESTPAPNPMATMNPEETTEYMDNWEAKYNWQWGPSELITRIATEFPDDYTTGRLLESTFEVSFKAAAPAEALAILATSSTPFEVHENLGYNEKDLNGVTAKIGEILEPLPLTGGASWGADPYEQRFSITIGFDDKNGTGLSDCLAVHTAELEAELAAIDSFGLPIVIESRWGEPVVSTDMAE